jgi:hypothetical protein
VTMVSLVLEVILKCKMIILDHDCLISGFVPFVDKIGCKAIVVVITFVYNSILGIRY